LQADAGADVKATDPDKTQAHKSAKRILDTKPSVGKRRLEEPIYRGSQAVLKEGGGLTCALVREASIAIDGDHPLLTVSARFGSVECPVRREFIRATHFEPFRNLTPAPRRSFRREGRGSGWPGDEVTSNNPSREGNL
jgi:hypothetical protein